MTVEYLKITDTHLDDVEAWIVRFNRYLEHVGNGSEVHPRDKIVYLWQASPEDKKVGAAWKIVAGTAEYQAAEVAGRSAEVPTGIRMDSVEIMSRI